MKFDSLGVLLHSVYDPQRFSVIARGNGNTHEEHGKPYGWIGSGFDLTRTAGEIYAVALYLTVRTNADQHEGDHEPH